MPGGQTALLVATLVALARWVALQVAVATPEAVLAAAQQPRA